MRRDSPLHTKVTTCCSRWVKTADSLPGARCMSGRIHNVDIASRRSVDVIARLPSGGMLRNHAMYFACIHVRCACYFDRPRPASVSQSARSRLAEEFAGRSFPWRRPPVSYDRRSWTLYEATRTRTGQASGTTWTGRAARATGRPRISGASPLIANNYTWRHK
jgi:hypothetical protein